MSDEEFWGGLDGDITAVQKKALEILARPRGVERLILTDLSGREIKAVAQLKAIATAVPDPILNAYIDTLLLLKRSHRRKGVKEIIAVAGGKAWKILQNISLSRLRRLRVEDWGEEV